jgi:hypothetical protein
MERENPDNNQDPTGAEGSAGSEGSPDGNRPSVEELQARLQDKDRQNTELATRLATLEARIAHGDATAEDKEEAEAIEKELESALEEAVVDPKAAAKKLREVVQKRIKTEVKTQTTAVMSEQDREARARAAIQADVESVFQKHPDLRPFEGEIARRARPLMQEGKSFKEAMFEAADAVARDQEAILKKRMGGQGAPSGSQGERGNQSSGSESARKPGSSADDLKDDPRDYIRERNAIRDKAHQAS